MNSEFEAIVAETVAWRRQLHSEPELSFEERLTSDFIAEKLSSIGIPIHRGLGGTGIVGTLTGTKGGRAVGFRADMDALPIQEQNVFGHRSKHSGVMHACGHDGHVAMLLGAAKMLAANRALEGTLHLIFQPAEEPGGGAQSMIDDGLFEKFPMDAVFGLHNAPFLPVGHFATRTGALMASEDNFVITVHGQGGHAARPNRGIDPIVCAAQIVTAIQTVVSRTVDPLEKAVVSFTEILTDGARNVIPNTVVLKGDTRSFSPAVQRTIAETMERISKGICDASGARCDFSYTHEFQPTITTPMATASAVEAARATFCNVDADCQPVMGSEDFSAMIKACGNGNFAFVGNAAPGDHAPANLHNPHYDFNDHAIPHGVNYWTALASHELRSG